MLTENSGDAPGYHTGITHNLPSTAMRVLGRGGVAASRRPECTPLAEIANWPQAASQCHICLTARWALLTPRFERLLVETFLIPDMLSHMPPTATLERQCILHPRRADPGSRMPMPLALLRLVETDGSSAGPFRKRDGAHRRPSDQSALGYRARGK